MNPSSGSLPAPELVWGVGILTEIQGDLPFTILNFKKIQTLHMIK
jgi:hypothetical protein